MKSIKKTARIAGVLYLAIFVIYPLATSVRSMLVVPGDAAATAQNVAANQTLFRWGMAGESVIFLIEIVMAGFLYVLLRPVSKSLSLASALARASEGIVMAATNLFTSILTLIVIGNAGYLAVFDQEQQNALGLGKPIGEGGFGTDPDFQAASRHSLVMGLYCQLELIFVVVHRM